MTTKTTITPIKKTCRSGGIPCRSFRKGYAADTENHMPLRRNFQVLKEFLESGFTKVITPARNPHSDTANLKVTGDVEAKIIATACSPAPEGRVRWTLNLLYNQMRVVLEDNISISRATREDPYEK